MTEKEKQIEEMREIVSTQRRICHGIECAECDYRGSFGSDCIDERNIAAFYAAGYRKQSDTINECIAWLKDHAHYDEEWSLVNAFCECFQEYEQ